MKKIKKFYDFCEEEMEKGGKYRIRIKNSNLYKELRREYKNIDDVIKKAEANDDTMSKTRELYRDVVNRLGADRKDYGLVRFEMILEDKELVEKYLYKYGTMAFKRMINGE